MTVEIGSSPDIYCNRSNLGIIPYTSYAAIQNDAANDILNPSGLGIYLAASTIYNYTFASGSISGTYYGLPILAADTGVDGVICNPTALSVGVTAPTYYLPINAVIKSITMRNTNGNAVTGGINVTTVGAVQVSAAAIPVAANAMVVTQGSSLTTAAFPAYTYPQSSYPNGIPLYFNAATAWNSAVVNVTIEFYVAA